MIAAFCVALGAGTAVALAPTIASTTVSGVTANSVVLEAEINPEGEATTYHFEYGLADCSSNLCTSDPLPDGNVGAGSTGVKISREIKGLQPGTTYHFRVVATNGSGPTASPDRTFTTYAGPATGSNCPNQEFRVGASASLPDCRAYEMVTPVDKDGGDIVSAISTGGAQTLTGFDQGSALGGKISYSSYRAFGDDNVSAPFTSQYLATRGADGWTSRSLNAPRGNSTPTFIPLATTEFKAYADDLSFGLMYHNTVDPLTPDAVPGYTNLFKRDNIGNVYTALTTVKPPNSTGGGYLPELQGASDDGSHVIFRAEDKLTPDAPVPPPNSSALYEWVEGTLRYVGVLPNGEPSTASTAAGTRNNLQVPGTLQSVDNAISDDGSRIFWSAGLTVGKIYVRINGQSTVPVSESVSSESARYWTASTDGAKVIFSIGTDLYEFDVDTETPTLIASQVPGVLGASDDLSHVYLMSQEALDAGATAGQPNVYLYQGGTFDFIATVTSSEASTSQTAVTPINARPIKHLAQVTPDGGHLAFVSAASLTGYDNTDTVKGTPDPEVYAYDAEAEELTCASCNPSGARPTGGTFLVGGNGGLNGAYFAAAIIPAWRTQLYQARALSDDGNRLFFESYDALVPQDTNGARDVYQWEAEGAGGCRQAGGCIDLLSTGKSTADSEFVDATPDGEEVFIRTLSSIDPRDPGLLDIYVAKVGGGFPYTPPVEGCVGDACQSPAAAPNDPTPASASFNGAGNPALPKARRSCRARGRHVKSARKSKKKQTKRCTRNNRRTGR